MSQPRPRSDKQLDKSIARETLETTKTYRYVNNQLISYGPVYRYDKGSADSWAVLRYLLETNHGTCFNNYTYVTGYTIDGKPLRGNDSLPDLVLVRRHPMPKGYRQHLPAELNRRYLLAEAELKTCKQIMDEASRSFLVDTDNYEYHNTVYKETLARSKKLTDTLDDIRDKAGLHASELHQEVKEYSTHTGVTFTRLLWRPPHSYVCPVCQTRGLHFKDACDTDLTQRSTELVFGAAKMKKL